MSANKQTLIDTVASLANNSKLCTIANSYGLSINNVAWEDCARDKNSCYGKNISDSTLCVENGSYSRKLPIIKHHNYSDKTCDIDISNFQVTIGNENGTDLKRISLEEYIKNLSKYTGNDKIKGQEFFLERDKKGILVSGQFCLLPLDHTQTEFNVKLYNYQSRPNNPAVLVIIVSSAGTSTQLITNGDTKLYFNKNGKACNFLADRLKEDRRKKGKALEGKMDLDEQERNALFIIQIPLKIKPVERHPYYGFGGPESKFSGGFGSQVGGGIAYPCATPASSWGTATPANNSWGTATQCVAPADYDWGFTFGITNESFGMSDYSVTKSQEQNMLKSLGFDHVVLEAGKPHSDFIGTKGSDNQHIFFERNPDFPIRLTVQFYSASDRADVSEETIQMMSEKINNLYKSGSAFGSLVMTTTKRPTEPTFGFDSSEATAMCLSPDEKLAKPMFSFFANST
ncbi:MAG: hypothetical protein Edafosvirus2_37 [Edafosvirus sp.]|uniref:Uncharacterized protein n=1 Tax=Edafosvirus sp. TaxID=2487765 RepID=A0A3G4ZSI7_9VIRU|nr:MAG: hypothetical protein Edafosvirus2_37 [Edafosvirus sp.]